MLLLLGVEVEPNESRMNPIELICLDNFKLVGLKVDNLNNCCRIVLNLKVEFEPEIPLPAW